MTILGSNIKAIREYWGLTQGQFAELLNASRSKIAQYESRDVMPNNETLSRLSDLTNLDKDDLVGRPLTRPQLPKMPSDIDTSLFDEEISHGANIDDLSLARIIRKKELDVTKLNEKREKSELTREILYLQELRNLLTEKAEILSVRVKSLLEENRILRERNAELKDELDSYKGRSNVQ